MTDSPVDPAQTEGTPDPVDPAQTEGEGAAADAAAPSPGTVGDAAAEAADESEVGGGSTSEHDQLVVTRMALEERTLDLQRLQAEYLNYKRRVERDRELVRENATYAALAPITEVLDTIDRARQHAPLEDGFKAVADQLERIVAGLGLTKFGEEGDPFDPTIHEALSHIGQDPGVEVTTCKVIAKAGYRIGDRVVRAAQVLVVDPAEPDQSAGPTDSGDSAEPAAGDAAPE